MRFAESESYDCIDNSLILRIVLQRSCSRVSSPDSVVAKHTLKDAFGVPLACSSLQPLGIRSFCTEQFAETSVSQCKMAAPSCLWAPKSHAKMSELFFHDLLPRESSYKRRVFK